MVYFLVHEKNHAGMQYDTQLCSGRPSWENSTTLSTCANIESPNVKIFVILGSDGSSRRTREISCNTQLCPTWSFWNASSSCSVTCGGGIRQLSSTCLYNGNPSALCDGKPRCKNRACSLCIVYEGLYLQQLQTRLIV